MDRSCKPTHIRRCPVAVVLRWFVFATLAVPAVAADPVPPAGAWKFDVLHLKNGRTVQGLLLEETPKTVRFHYVRQKPGAPTVAIATTFDRAEIGQIERLNAKDREVLEGRLRALEADGKEERVRMEKVQLQAVRWRGDPKGGLSYPSAHFVLVSNARPDTIRRAAVRLEQIYAAYTRFLPPRHAAAKPTTILLVRSLAEYQALLQEQRRNIFNPAFYDATANQVVCASDLERLGDLLEDARKRHEDQLEQIRKNEEQVKKLPKGPLRDRLRKENQKFRQDIANANEKNDALFRTATQRLFQTLYHEAFHAYLANFVYPPAEAEVPRWLNEGLAQIFETALVEAGELRVGHADKDRLERIKAAVRKGDVLPLDALLKAGPKEFLVNHASDQQVSDRCYLASWALAFHLTFERRLLGTTRLDEYVRACQRGVEPTAAFRDLVGQPVPAFEKAFHQYLLNLRSDGTVSAGGK